MVTRRIAPSPDYERLVHFLMVGASSLLVDHMVLVLLLAVGLPVLAAHVLWFTSGIGKTYVWNRT